MFIPIIYTGATTDKREEAVTQQLAGIDVSSFDTHHIRSESATGSITIAQIKKLIQTLSLSPVQGRYKAGIVYDMHRATSEAQNALLKLLEEPDTHTHLILTAERASLLLPTITSRCTIVKITTPAPDIPNSTDIFSASDGEKLSFAEELAQNTDSAYDTMTGWIVTLRSHALKTARSEISPLPTIRLIRKIGRAQQALRRSAVNARLLVENLLLEG